ncbi:carbohydrate ABC transporter permease [Collimonas silvisoli]|uniref:carbohydrate ABC transporter permease n=1 Tax=Collimonas silvisoli TaxID=2825884 RepID=UPI001B8C35D3|nr:carbohydrate ABC transporter permease [Collimonas silvisoli]
MTRRHPLATIGFYLFAGIILIYALFPFFYAISSSLRGGSAMFDPELLPSSVTFSHYVDVFLEQPFQLNILNSIVVAVGVVAISMLLAILAAYALARIQFRGRRLLLFSILTVSMFPQVAILSGMFELIRGLKLYDNIGALVIADLIFTLPFTVWVLVTFMRDLPKELEEAAIMDGAGPLRIVFKVFFPLLWPALAATSLLAFIAAWNEFLFALTFTLSGDERTVPVAISMISGASSHELPWGNIMAASVVVTLPVIAVVLFFQRYIVSGLTAGAVKG